MNVWDLPSCVFRANTRTTEPIRTMLVRFQFHDDIGIVWFQFQVNALLLPPALPSKAYKSPTTHKMIRMLMIEHPNIRYFTFIVSHIREGSRNPNCGSRPLKGHTVDQSRDYRPLCTSLIFQVVSYELDVNLSKHITLTILGHINRKFKFIFESVSNKKSELELWCFLLLT